MKLLDGLRELEAHLIDLCASGRAVLRDYDALYHTRMVIRCEEKRERRRMAEQAFAEYAGLVEDRHAD